ncbi:MAG TPA: hypothetical protein VFW00_00420, partial [Rhodocyclaceae bacterium]|nr:hypothetical protein [Rhodocyclaceae bacterium]
VSVTIERDSAQEDKGVYRLQTQLSVTGNVSDAQRQELLRVVSKCPIHRLMTDVKTEIETVLI